MYSRYSCCDIILKMFKVLIHKCESWNKIVLPILMTMHFSTKRYLWCLRTLFIFHWILNALSCCFAVLQAHQCAIRSITYNDTIRFEKCISFKTWYSNVCKKNETFYILEFLKYRRRSWQLVMTILLLKRVINASVYEVRVFTND